MSGARHRGRSVRRPVDQSLLRQVVEALADRKAVDPVVLDLRGLSEATDYFVIASGTSDTQVRGMAEHLMETLARDEGSAGGGGEEGGGVKPHHVEGLTQGKWVLLDYVDIVVHIFHPDLRAFYQLERLWGDAPVVAAGSSEPKG